jgi:hypothetical protein
MGVTRDDFIKYPRTPHLRAHRSRRCRDWPSENGPARIRGKGETQRALAASGDGAQSTRGRGGHVGVKATARKESYMDANAVAELFAEKESPQGELFNVGDFRRFAEQRGIRVGGLEREAFESWDFHSLLRPIVKVRSVSSRHLVRRRQAGTIQYDPASLNRRLRKGEEVITLPYWAT